MKKKICLLVCLMMLCLMTGCASTEGGDLPDETGGTVQAEDWTYRLSTRPESGEIRVDERLVARYRYEVPVMDVFHADGTPWEEQGEPAEAAAAFNGYFEERLTKQQAWFDEMAAEAQDDYAMRGSEAGSLWDSENFFYTDEMTASFWNNDHIATVTLQLYSYTGGAHGYGMREGITFDMDTGKTISIGDTLADYKGTKKAVEQEILRQIDALIEENGEAMFFEDYAETVEGWDERAIFFDDEGMTVSFAVYDIASYAAGEQNFLISYDLLAPYLNDYGREMLELA